MLPRQLECQRPLLKFGVGDACEEEEEEEEEEEKEQEEAQAEEEEDEGELRKTRATRGP